MCVRPAVPGFSPLDEALGLSSSSPYSPRVLTWLVRLGAELPFARAAFWLAELTGLTVSAATVRRHTEAVGATAVAQAEAEVARLEREMPVPRVHPERLVVGADGAMVPLVGGDWAEVKLASIGEPADTARSALVPHAGVPVRTQHLSYFARLADAETFGRQALGERHRRGLERAAAVAAVQDGAPWLQGFIDLHRPDALRILDWPHAAQHLTDVAEAVFGVQTARAHRVAERLRRWLWEEGPPRVLAILAGWERAYAAPDHPQRPAVATAVAYFRERRAQLDYPAFRAAGWPVGSGATESGHKQVMQARMKRAGMRWARSHVNPLLAVTLVEHNGRWGTDGPTLLAQHRTHCIRQRHLRQHARRAARQCRHGQGARQQAPCALQHLSPPTTNATRPAMPAPPAPAPAPPLPAQQRLPAVPTRHPWRHYNPGWLSAKN